MRRRDGRLEEYHSGKTTDLRNVVAEIQKVDEETMDLQNVVEEVKKKNGKTFVHQRNTIITCRLLFSSILDKVYLILLIGSFIVLSFLNFRGNIFSGFYGFWMRFLKECGLVFLYIIFYFICTWFYHCAIRTMMCLTKNEIRIERYFPLIRLETSIPIQHVTSISTFNIFFIFRSVIIHRYHQLPVIFFTWHNQKFKNRVMEVLGEEGTIINYYDDTGILAPRYYRFMRWFIIIFLMILLMLGFVRLFGYVFSHERIVSGTYVNEMKKIVLKNNGECKISINKYVNPKKCTWEIADNEELIFHVDGRKVQVAYNDKAIRYNDVKYSKK